jgi:Zn-dependent protease with chaperone function
VFRFRNRAHFVIPSGRVLSLRLLGAVGLRVRSTAILQGAQRVVAISTSAFTALVARVEQDAQAQPVAYRRRLRGLAALGYVYIVAVLLVLVAVAVGLFVYSVKADPDRLTWTGTFIRYVVRALIFAAGAAIFFAVRGLFARSPAPSGLPLRRKQVPTLFDALDDARSAANGPKIHRVLLTDDFNAAIVQQPLLGPLGWHRNHVLIGLPLLDALSPDEVQAVLAHEMGHLAGGHGRFASKMYAIRRTWSSLLEGLERHDAIACWLFIPFFAWYAPFFAAHSFVLARDQEREADRLAARLAGGRALADALLKLDIFGGYLAETFWPAVSRRADETPEPPAAIFDEIAATLRAGLPADEANGRLAAALAQDADVGDTHPSLTQRLTALEERPRIPPTTDVTAAEYLLGASLADLRAQVNQTWQADARAAWEARHHELQAQAARLNELEEQAARGPLSFHDQWERARLTRSVCGNQWAVVRYRQLVRARPSSADAELALGRTLLAEHDDAGLEAIEAAVRLDPILVDEAQREVEAYLTRWARTAELAEYRRRFGKVREKLESEDDHLSFQPNDVFSPHGASALELSPLRDRLERCPGVAAAYLVRWQWTAFPDATIYVVATVPDRSAARNDAALHAIFSHFRDAHDLPGNTRLQMLGPGTDALRRAIEQVHGSLIYQRDERQSRSAA